MATSKLQENRQANEAVSKYKLLSAYGGPGSIIHTQYGSVIISCIEEWGFLKKVIELDQNNRIASGRKEREILQLVAEQASLPANGNISISNDKRLRSKLIDRKSFASQNFKYLVLVPDVELKDYNNRISNNSTFLAIPSTFMPKIFSDRSKVHKPYHRWFQQWVQVNDDDRYGNNFFPPKKNWKEQNGRLERTEWTEVLKQDNLVLICNHGHISDFPWAQFLRWKSENPIGILKEQTADLFNTPPCCGSENKPTARIVISSNSANSSGFEGMYLKCLNCNSRTSLKGIMSIKVNCPGHKPWEAKTGEPERHSGNKFVRNQSPPLQIGGCHSRNSMKVALTTGNNLYYSRAMSSIYLPDELFEPDFEMKKENLISKRDDIRSKIKEEEDEEFKAALEQRLEKLVAEIEDLKEEKENDTPDSEKEIQFRFQEYDIFTGKTEKEINQEEKFLKVKDVTTNLKNDDYDLTTFFRRVLRIDNMKITSAQLDFSRVEPADADADGTFSQNIFRSKPEDVCAYPVVENYGEGIFFAINDEKLDYFLRENIAYIKEWESSLSQIQYDNFSRQAVEYGQNLNWPLYLIHSFSHLLMRELEFRCGYPTASLSERIYVCKDEKYKMNGFIIYTAEGAEGSMGGLIAQTKGDNLINLIRSALKRATICHSDPLCWESDGQGLFDLNFASCFSCSLVSETSCELRNIYLDRKLLVDENYGFFSALIQ